MNIDSQLLQKITEQTDIILWLEDSPLTTSLTHFPTMDYLLDGLLTQYTQTMSDIKEAEFVHQHFEKTLRILFRLNSSTELKLEHIKAEEKKHGFIIGHFSTSGSLVDLFRKQVAWVDEILTIL